MTPFKQALLPEIKLETFYDNGKRFYITPEGNRYKSVTTALSFLNAKQIAEWRAKVGEDQLRKSLPQQALEELNSTKYAKTM